MRVLFDAVDLTALLLGVQAILVGIIGVLVVFMGYAFIRYALDGYYDRKRVRESDD